MGCILFFLKMAQSHAQAYTHAHAQILEGKTAFITGAGSGIGRALAVGFAKYGADIILAGRNEAKMIETQEIITTIGRQSLVTVVDVQKYEDFVRAFKTAKDKFGRIDILINNAGYSRLYPFTHPKCTQEILDTIVKTNIFGPLYGSHAVLPFMIDQGGGTILSTGSTIIDQPAPGWTAYSMSKSSLVGFTECLATELSQNKITVNLIMPRMVRTPMLRGMKEELIDSLKPMQPEELVDYFAFFATKNGTKLSGQVVNVEHIQAIIEKALDLPMDQRNWSSLKSQAEESLPKDVFKKIKKQRKLLDFLLECNPIQNV